MIQLGMLISSFVKRIGWKRGECERCGRTRWLCQHHISRRQNSDKVVWICSNGNPAGVLYIDACHHWIHSNPKKARKEGYYDEIDSVYRKKESNPNKWKIKKGSNLHIGSQKGEC